MIELLQQRLTLYKPNNALEEMQATKEIAQETVLYSLWRGGFFEVAAFQGGTSLRILHKLPRFSEDLDFILKVPAPQFSWTRYLPPLVAVLEEFGLHAEAVDKSRMDRNIREAALKDDSIANQLNLKFFRGSAERALKIKLEIDVNPPADSGFAYTYLDFPLDFEVCHQDLPSNFALKIHALLCRPYLKGRDWYDFGWYVRQRVSPNLPHLKAALFQNGPWANQMIEIDDNWVAARLNEKVTTIDWKAAAQDIERFLNVAEKKSLSLWSVDFFKNKVDQLLAAIKSH